MLHSSLNEASIQPIRRFSMHHLAKRDPTDAASSLMQQCGNLGCRPSQGYPFIASSVILSASILSIDLKRALFRRWKGASLRVALQCSTPQAADRCTALTNAKLVSYRVQPGGVMMVGCSVPEHADDGRFQTALEDSTAPVGWTAPAGDSAHVITRTWLAWRSALQLSEADWPCSADNTETMFSCTRSHND